MVKITLLNYISMSLFIQDKLTLYSDLLQSYDNSMLSSNAQLAQRRFMSGNTDDI